MAKKTKRTKTNSRKGTSQTIERRRPYQKAAIRSHAFARAVLNAASYSLDPVSLRTLFEEAAQKVAAIPKEPFKDSWPYLQAMLRLIRAYFARESRTVAQDMIV